MIRTSFDDLVKRLGEPASMEPFQKSGTVFVYRLRWSCGCHAEGARDHYTCRLCTTHAHH